MGNDRGVTARIRGSIRIAFVLRFRSWPKPFATELAIVPHYFLTAQKDAPFPTHSHCTEPLSTLRDAKLVRTVSLRLSVCERRLGAIS